MKCIKVFFTFLILTLIAQSGFVYGDSTYSGASAWAVAELNKAENYGLITEKIKEKMNEPISREEFAELAVRLYEKTKGVKAAYVEENKFSDTKNEEIYKAYNLNIVNGTDMEKRLFSPNQLTNREQVAAMLYRTAQAIDPDTDLSTDGVDSFSDQSIVSSWALESLKYMYKHGFLKGSDEKIDPKGTCTREMAAIIASRIFEKSTGASSGTPQDSTPSASSDASPGSLLGASPDESPNKSSLNALKNCKWELKVMDTKKGKWIAPMDAGALEIDVWVDIHAWKNGGTSVLGKYYGEAYITHKVDISKLSNEEYSSFGDALFDRKCEKLEFEIVPYDLDEYFKHVMGEKVAPLMEFTSMANFKANFSTYHTDGDFTYIERSTGESANITHTGGDETLVPVGINLRIEGVRVKVDIPTYTGFWGTGLFDGTIIGTPITK